MVLTVSFALSLVNRACLPPSPADMSCLSPVGPTRLRKLDASVGASGPRDFAVRCNISRPLAVDRSQVFQLALQSRRAQNAAASTASHPASVTIAIRPSVERDGDSSRFDLGCVGTEISFGKSEIRLDTKLPDGQITRANARTSYPWSRGGGPVRWNSHPPCRNRRVCCGPFFCEAG